MPLRLTFQDVAVMRFRNPPLGRRGGVRFGSASIVLLGRGVRTTAVDDVFRWILTATSAESRTIED